MDDFGNDYIDETYMYWSTQYCYSMATFGMMDQVAFDIVWDYQADYATQDI